MNREKLINVYENTMYMCENNPTLSRSVAYSISTGKYIKSSELGCISNRYGKSTEVSVSDRSTFEAARLLSKKYHKVTVLNFASARHPGGGVANGARAQEECLCRCSTLYPVISNVKFSRYYQENENCKDKCLYTDGLILSKNVVVFKDEDYSLFPEEDWFLVDVITCPAPNYSATIRSGNIMVKDETIYNIFKRRVKNILLVTANSLSSSSGALVLGAWGCGVFGNNPELVADASLSAIRELDGVVDYVEFAIYCQGKNKSNYNAFELGVYMR